ncbi:hypothetical protein QC761_503795 [Podospora bellae-mahoneyi]|uniref:Uncharacterized protein n=1 Tax=Podospora bellae-mahoneyi TaxID=2093777 RepID=A0ABR0FFB4_9PEZI|nr:hypothetical protein QC761_503795 [Podospora bellae-mahoneyi]
MIPYKQLGFSDQCMTSVNTTLPSCPGWLHTHTGIGDASFQLLEDCQLRELCDSSCKKELGNLRNSIKAACTAKQDLVVPRRAGGIAYPGRSHSVFAIPSCPTRFACKSLTAFSVSFFADLYLYAAEA